MRCICPACGATVSLEAFLTDAEARQFMVVLTRLSASVVPLAPRYLALFRPTKTRNMQWRKATRLLEDLEALITKGHVHRQGQVDRPCTPKTWADAIERIIFTPPTRLPLKNHQYLAAIAWDIAEDVDKRREASEEAAKKRQADLSQHTANQHAAMQPPAMHPPAMNPPTANPHANVRRGGGLKPIGTPLTPERMREIRRKSREKAERNMEESKGNPTQ